MRCFPVAYLALRCVEDLIVKKTVVKNGETSLCRYPAEQFQSFKHEVKFSSQTLSKRV